MSPEAIRKLAEEMGWHYFSISKNATNGEDYDLRIYYVMNGSFTPTGAWEVVTKMRWNLEEFGAGQWHCVGARNNYQFDADPIRAVELAVEAWADE